MTKSFTKKQNTFFDLFCLFLGKLEFSSKIELSRRHLPAQS